MRVVRGIVATALLCTIAGCARRAIIPFTLDDRGIDFAFVALLDPAGRVTRTFPLVDLRAPGAELPHAIAGELDAEVAVAGFTEADLASAVRDVDLDRRAELAVEEGSACAEGTTAAGGRHVLAPFPSGTRILRGAIPFDGALALSPSESQAFLTGMVLRVPVDLERCLGASPVVLAPFVRPEGAFDRPVLIGGVELEASRTVELMSVARISDDRVVAAARNVLYVLERGKVFEDRRGHHARIGPGPEDDSFILDVAIDRSRSTAGRTFGSAVVASQVGGGAVHDFEVDAAGVLTASTATRTGAGLNRVGYTARGELIAVGYKGLIVTRDAPGAPFRAERFEDRREDPPTPSLTQLAVPELPGAGVLIGSRRGRMWIGPTVRGPWTVSAIDPLVIGTAHLSGVAATRTSQGVDLWAGGEDGALYRRPERAEWQTVRADPPPSFARCARNPDACGRTSPATALWDVVPVPGAIFAPVQTCRGALLYRIDGACAATVQLATFPIRQPSAELRAADVWGGWLTAVGAEGQVYELRVGE